MNIGEEILKHTELVYPEVVQHYRHLHRYPELSYQEKETAAYVSAFLRSEGVTVRNGVGGYGIVATVSGTRARSDQSIAFVADMDALPILRGK